jgi:RNA polymerase sigma-70 factor, ECF subfamily
MWWVYCTTARMPLRLKIHTRCRDFASFFLCLVFIGRMLFLMTTTFVWAAFSQNMHRYLMQRLKNRHDADDLLQEIFIKIHLNLHTLNSEQGLPAWVWQLTRNTLLDYYKKRRLPISSLDMAAEKSADTAMPSDFTAFVELLPEAQREAIILADFEHIAQKELAVRWGISHSGAKSRVQRARNELHGLFLNCCAIEADCYGNIMSVECLERRC